MIVDSHCHLDYSVLYNELDSVISRAISKDVNTLLTICTTLDSYEKIKIITNKYDNVFGTFGIHPHETKNFLNINSDLIIKYINNNKKIIGIGETGLDYYYNHSDQLIQKQIFHQHIEAAYELDLPLIVHSRNAETDTFNILKENMNGNKLKVIVHCFTGSKEFAKKLIDIGCYISISGIITFKKNEELIAANTLNKKLEAELAIVRRYNISKMKTETNDQIIKSERTGNGKRTTETANENKKRKRKRKCKRKRKHEHKHNHKDWPKNN